ncbi:MAG: T9SS type A sorting domain-containing protein [Bacteroidales bacterium]|nr:T9SS type A sorting domain-containing protein [Bacteroidales bacterium]
MEILNENSGPPYSYSFTKGGFFTKAAFLSAGAFCPNYNTPQTYIDPAIVEFSIDESGNIIDSIVQKKSIYDVLPMLHNFPPNETVGIFYSCGENDEYHIYPANLALNDTLDALGFPYVFLSHDGWHNMPGVFKEQALIFIDSLMMGSLAGINKNFDLTFDFEFSIFPNPIKNLADISFNLSVSSNVNFEIIDLTGNLIQSSYYGQLQKGKHRIPLSTTVLCEGIYFCRLKIGDQIISKKIIKVK